MQVWDLVSPLAAELGLQEPRLYMAESGAPVNASAPATLLNGEPLMMQEGQTPWDERSASDVRLRIVEELLSSEKEYCHTLKTVSDLYEKPLRKLLSMEKEDYKSFFDWVEPICSLSKMLIIKLTMVMEEWETLETKVAPIFSKLLWNKYEEYQTLYIDITLPLLKEKETTDEDFVSLCQLRRGAAKYSLAGLLELPLERLVQYERYLSLLAEQTTPDHPDYNDICRTANKAAAMVKRADLGREESDLDRIQDLFPSDHLRLHDKDPLSPRKGLMRSKSSAASKIQRALPGKSKACNGDMPCSPSRPEALSFQKKHLWGDDNFRVFIMESPVNFTMGVQKQDRHLFLFNDLLLVAKPRSGGTYKLKEKIRMGEIWLSQCIGDVCESIKSPATSFVIGWPTTNVVVTFNSLKTKDLWQQKLIQLIEESKEKEGKSLTSIQIAYRKPETGEEICKTLKVDNRQTVQDSIKQVLQQIGGFSESSLKDFKLWVKTGKDEAPYPLIGHEYPFCIKMNFIRELLRRSELNLQHVNKFSTDLECRFTLRRNSYNSSIRSDPRVPKKRKKHRKPHPKINWPFRKPASKHDSVDSGNSSPPPHNLFGLPLWKICPDTVLPKPVMSMLVQLFLQGPYTVGIFRKSANARSCRELKEKLEADPESDISNISVIVLSSVFKEFLRSLPDCLLQSDLYKSWLQATSYEGEECVKRVISLLTQLPPANIKLLQYLLCMLWHISQHSSENKMSSMNLAVCIGPTLLNPGKFQSPVLQQEDVAEKVPKAVAFLIDNCALLFGDQILQLFGPFPERDVSRQDSGAEESDSLHSLHDHPGQYRRDDSSIDSLDRDFLDEIEPSPKMEGKKMSLTNLSRDSGLTNSDTQLYTAEEEVESEYSSADSRRGTSAALTKSVPHLDTAGIDCNTASYGKNAGISIDGSCYDVVRKRRQGMEAHRTKSLAASYNHREYGYDSSPHLPLQLSQSYSYSMQQDLMDRGYDSFVRNYHNPVRRRDMRGRSVVQRPVVSAVEPIEDFAEGTLRRSASEESLLQNYSNTSASKRLLNQRKRRAPSPPHQKGTVSAPCSSKKSDGNKNNLSREMSSCSIGRTVDRHAVWFATHSRRTDWKRSQSTSKIDEMDLSHDSSTLSLVSSEDSTPQVSRSSSRVQELSSKSHSDLYAMYYSPPRVNSVCSSTSDGSQQSRNSSVKSNCSHKSQNGTAKPSEPPSYLEAINRQTMLKNLQTSPLKQVTEEMRAEQTSLSAKARELYENSVRMYSQQIPSRLSADSSAEDETHRAVPASIDCTDGLLKTSVKGTQTSPKPGQDSSHIRLRHLPPVHVTDAQLHRVRNFHIRPRHTREIMPEELRREINWSVAELRDMFNNRTPQDSSRSPCSFTEKFLENREGLTNGRSPRRMSQQQHTRSRSLSSRSEEESFV